jgi:hypothetical protein
MGGKIMKTLKNYRNIPQDLLFWQSNPTLFSDLGYELLDETELQNLHSEKITNFKDNIEFEIFQEILKRVVFVAKRKNDYLLGYWGHQTSSLTKALIVLYERDSYFTFFDAKDGHLCEAIVLDYIETGEAKEFYEKERKKYFVLKLKNEEERKYKQEILNKLYGDFIREHYQEKQAQLKVQGLHLRDYDETQKEHPQYDEVDEFYYNCEKGLEHGKDLSHLEIEVSQEDFTKYRHPQFGTHNPTKVNSKFWQYAITNRDGSSETDERLGAYTLNKKFNPNYENESSYKVPPTWCFNRFGRTLTRVDGKEIFIAGEHEDFYDPDFNIYNDVVVIHPDNTIDVYTYPEDVFPPTDFHSATLIGDEIIIIGNLGYSKNIKIGQTQVLSLHTQTFKITKLTTTNPPGWIHQHRAILSDDGKSIVISGGLVELSDEKPFYKNNEAYALNLETLVWQQKTNNNYPQWYYKRADGKNNNIYDIRRALWYKEKKWNDDFHQKSLEKNLGFIPDLKKIQALYDFSKFDTSELQKDAYNEYSINMNDVVIKFTEEHEYLRIVVCGDLEVNVLNTIKEEIKLRLEDLEKTAFEICEFNFKRSIRGLKCY